MSLPDDSPDPAADAGPDADAGAGASPAGDGGDTPASSDAASPTRDAAPSPTTDAAPSPTRDAAPSPTTDAAASPAARIAAQRQLVYGLTGLLVVAGVVLVAALRDPCVHLVDPLLKAMCRPTLADRVPPATSVFTMLAMVAALVAAYELRWSLRAPLAAVVGASQLLVGAAAASRGASAVLVVACVLVGVSLVASAAGVWRNQRTAWAVALSTCSVLTVLYFFGAPKLATAAGWPLAMGLLPALALLLPATVALAASAPGTPVNVPFSSRARA